jgi:Zn finger protein HypA/HybF involved in hydrogenase expression
MHEFTITDNLVKFLRKFCREKAIEKVISINLDISPYSCLDSDNINFVFSSLAKNDPALKEAKIEIHRNKTPMEREIVIKNIEIEEKNGN